MSMSSVRLVAAKLLTNAPQVLLAASTCLLTACGTPQPAPVPASALSNTPQLKRFNHFEIELQGSGTNGAQLNTTGTLTFLPNAAAFEATAADASNVGRLVVQPDECRDDPSEGCARKFVISGRLNVFKTTVNCFVAVRNDTALGYVGQSLTGICQDRNSRGYSLTLFSN